MKKLFIVANWKSNKTSQQAKDWLAEISNIKSCLPVCRQARSADRSQISNIENKEIIICSSFTLFSIVKSSITDYQLPFKVGAQDISPFASGAYTGEVRGEQIKEFADYVIIGHSERRQNFVETDEIVSKKVEMANKYNLTPIFCIQDGKTIIPSGVKIVAYEPIFAIGTGNPDTPENAENVARLIKEKNEIDYVLYGGSVTLKNVKNFTQTPNINGVLVGGSSLDPKEFLEIIKNA